MIKKIKEWLVARKLKSIEMTEAKLGEFFEKPSGIGWHDKGVNDDMQRFLEEIDIFNMLFRKELEKEQRKIIIDFASHIEDLIRCYNRDDVLEAIEEKGLSKEKLGEEIKKVDSIVRKVRIKTQNFNLVKDFSETGRESSFGIWDAALLLLMRRFDEVYRGKEYVFVGGVAIQLWINFMTGSKDALTNDEIKKVCRKTHDLDIIFPEGTDFFGLIDELNFDGDMFDMPLTIKIQRKGKKRPLINVEVLDNDEIYEAVIPLNISNTYKDAINATEELYDQTIKNAADVECFLNEKKMPFRTTSVESTIIGKAQRATEKDIYDIKLLLKYSKKAGIEINFDYMRENIKPEKFSELLSKITS